jgi:hypothetical protein
VVAIHKQIMNLVKLIEISSNEVYSEVRWEDICLIHILSKMIGHKEMLQYYCSTYLRIE